MEIETVLSVNNGFLFIDTYVDGALIEGDFLRV